MWGLIARVAAMPCVAQWLYKRAERTPYTHIRSADGRSLYMGRWWLFNPYPESGAAKRWEWLPSIRVHHICRADSDRHLHDHPWNARTIILRGVYVEERLDGKQLLRAPGETAAIKHGEYHRIVSVSPDGVWTLFITWRYQGTWGFFVDGKKVPWRQYLGVK